MGLGSLECGAKCAKYLLFVFNFIFWIAGAALMAVGIWVHVDQSSFTENIGKVLKAVDFEGFDLKTSATIFIVVGVFIFVVGFCGCYGAIKEVKCFLVIYIILIALVVVIELGGAIYAATQKKQFLSLSKDKLGKYIENDYTGHTAVDIAWNALFQEFKCCGANGPDDFLKNKNFSTSVPLYCCVPKDGYKFDEKTMEAKDKGKCYAKVDGFIFKTGCVDAFDAMVQSKLGVVIGIGFAVIAIEILGIIFAICLCRAISRDQNYA